MLPPEMKGSSTLRAAVPWVLLAVVLLVPVVLVLLAERQAQWARWPKE